MHRADAALDVVQGVPGEGAPWRLAEQEAERGPGVDGDAAIFQTVDQRFEARLADHG